jgi:hypothetical protein
MIEQAIYGSQDVGGYRFLARSPGFLDAWLGPAERLCAGFGERPAGASCPAAVFARPLGPRHVAVVQVADQGVDDAGRPGALGFRLLVLPRRLYADLAGDPFHVADQYPPPWEARGELPALEWTAGPPPSRSVAELQKVLAVPHSDTLLGGTQALVDGGRVVFERTEPAPDLLRSLWALLPTSTRSTLWPASYAFSNALGFDAVVLPRAAGPGLEHHVREAQAGDYPEGHYEKSLQVAVEAGDQADVDALLARRSRSQTLRMALFLLAALMIIQLLFSVGPPPRADKPPPPEQAADKKPADKPPPKPAEPVPAVLRLPDVPRLTDQERPLLAQRLQDLGRRVGVAVPPGDGAADLARALVALDDGLDARPGASRPPRDITAQRQQGAPHELLRALLWKHDVPDYADPGRLNPAELVDRLEEKLFPSGARKEPKHD